MLGVGVGDDEAAAADDAVRQAAALYAAAAWDAPSMRWASADELGDEAILIEEVARLAPIETRDRIRWVEGFALDDGRPMWVPAILVHLGLPVAVEAESFWAASVAGLAVGDGLGAAVLGGLLDLVARDALAIARTRAVALPSAAETEGGIAVFDATTDVGVPAVIAQARDSFECGVAAATTTAAARVGAINDLVRRRVRRAVAAYPEEPQPDPSFEASVSGAALADDEPVDLSKPALVTRLRRVGVAGYAVDLTTDELARVGWSAARVVVPGLSPLPPRPGWTDHARLARVAQ